MTSQIRDEWVEDEINLLDYWQVIAKHKLLILGLTLASVFAVGFHSYYIAVKIYESKASILAPKESSGGAAGFSALMAGGGGAGQFLGGLISGSGSNRDTFIAILKSRTMAEDLVDRFKLKHYYNAKFKEQAIRAVQGATDITVSKEGVIVIKVQDSDAKLAADIANAYVTQLDRLFVKMGTTEGTRQRAFIADRMEQTEKALRQAEEALRRFQERNKAVVLPEQSKGVIDSSAKLRAEIAAAEVQFEAMRTYATESNPNVIQHKTRIQELKRQLAQMQYEKIDLPAASATPGTSRQEFHVPFTKVPELGMELVRLTREVKVQEAVFTLLTQQYEQAKIQEAKDTATVQLLDRAVPAEFKSKPQTVKNMAVAGVVSLFITIILAFVIDSVQRARRQQKTAHAF